MAKVSIEFETGNAAFDENAGAECAAALRWLGQTLAADGVEPGRSYPLRDHNGNRIGWCKIDDAGE